MISLRSISLLLVVCVAASGCGSLFKRNQGPALSGHLTGNVTYRERIALPPGSRIIVSLEDVTRANRTGQFVAQQTMEPKTQVPIAFDLHYLPQTIKKDNRYAISATIVDGQEQPIWSSESIPVSFVDQDKPISILVVRVSNLDVAPAPKTVVPFKCDEIALIARFGKDSVEIMMPGRTITLPQVISGSGACYSDGSTTFWNKGEMALFEMNGVDYKGCRADPLPAGDKQEK